MEDIDNKETDVEKQHCKCHISESWGKIFIISAAVCVGTFLAVYFVASQMLRPIPPYKYDKMFEKIFEEQEHDMYKLQKQFRKKQLKMMRDFDEAAAPISMWEEDDDGYKMTIFLKYFDNNIDNIKFNITPEKVTVSGNTEKENKNSFSSLTYSQSYRPAEKIDTKNIKKEIKDNKVIIYLPFIEKF